MKNLLIIFIISLTTAENPAIKEFANANNLFTQDVYKQVTQTYDGNFLVSPFSAETVLAFAQSGCKGESAEELRNALHLPNDKDKVESAIKTLLPKFKSNEQYTLHTANKIYVKENFSIKDGFKNAASLVYQVDSESIDFIKNVDAAKTINDWVEKQTNNKIKNLINSDDLDENTRAILINALYFKANWSHPFSLVDTKRTDFYKTPSDVVKVDTLNQYKTNFHYYECPHLKAQLLELPFQGNEATMVIVLPNEKDGLSSLESQLDRVFSSQHQLERTYLNVALPKFKIETSVDFKKILIKLGAEKVFDRDKADLSDIAGKKGDLFINKVAQKTFIDVGEEGVEAAAATFVAISNIKSLAETILVTKDFIADHPFIFFVKVGEVIIFAGRVTDPSK